MPTNRTVRVNELVKREIAGILRQDHREEMAPTTIVDVEISPDLRTGKVFYSVLGGPAERIEAEGFFHRNARSIRQKIGNRIRLKYTPLLTYHADDSIERGSEVLRILDELEED